MRRQTHMHERNTFGCNRLTCQQTLTPGRAKGVSFAIVAEIFRDVHQDVQKKTEAITPTKTPSTGKNSSGGVTAHRLLLLYTLILRIATGNLHNGMKKTEAKTKRQP